MEAQAFGVPVLATDVSGIPELVTHGADGWLVPERDPHALAEAIALLVRDHPLRRKLGESGAANVRQKFSSDPGIDLVAKLLRGSRSKRAAA
jgi:glycosyltransferase involved in cell wall biosynthesis